VIEASSAAEKYFCPSPRATARLTAITSSDAAPETSPITTGTPVLAEIRPSARGTQMKTYAAAHPSTCPQPVSVTVPSAATEPPSPVSTSFSASIRPCSEVICRAGRTAAQVIEHVATS